MHGLFRRGVQPRDHRRRRAGRHEQAIPAIRRIVGHAAFRDRRHLAQRLCLRALRGRDRHRPQLAALQVRRDRGCRGEHHIDLPAEQVRDGRAAAAIRNVVDIDLGHLLEQLTGQVRRSAGALRGVVELAGPGPGGCDQVLHGLDGAVRLHHQHIGGAAHQHDGSECLLRIERQLPVQARIDRVGDRRHHQRVAVGRALGHRIGADDGAAARLVVDDDWLAQVLAHGDAHRPRQVVGAAARGERHHHADRLVGKGCKRRQRRCRGHEERDGCLG
ncbi:hypothetical protein D9M72_369200 [compost metagenome]